MMLRQLIKSLKKEIQNESRKQRKFIILKVDDLANSVNVVLWNVLFDIQVECSNKLMI
jgi:hypothetical protein